MDLTALANKSNTDKGTVTGQGHGYSLVYDLLFAGRRLEPLNFCEIGLCIGGPEVTSGSIDRTVNDLPSIKMWREYFPNAKLYGVDISDFSALRMTGSSLCARTPATRNSFRKWPISVFRSTS